MVRASLRTIRPLVAGLKARGIDPEPLLSQAGVAPASLSDPDARIPASTIHALWRETAEASGDRDFGLRTAQGIRPGSFDVLDYVCRNCATVEEGLRLYCRYTPLLHDTITASVDKTVRGLQLRHVLRDGTVLPRQYAEFIIGSLLVIVRQATEHRVVPQNVQFIHSRPEDTSTHRAFFECPIEFGREFNGFLLHSADAARPLQRAEPGLLAVLEQHAEHLLEESRPVSTFVAQVRAAIVEQLRTGTVSATLVAERLGISQRTLRRHLDADGTTYQQQLTELRTELALRYMDDTTFSTDEIALLLGFADRTSFIRAFRQWTDRTPSEYRRRRESNAR
jgi:AraC-like DNA-binding protein